MATDLKWKDRLLSSSIPLEYEIAKILTQNKFSVSFDYAYQRLDGQLEKEFSVDIKADAFWPFNENAAVKANIDLLIECKYRNPNVSWLFIPELIEEEYSKFSSKGVIKLIDEFSQAANRDSAFGLPVCETCLKGVEVNTQNGEVHDSGITHGISQLVYSLPLLVKEHIYRCLSGSIDEAYPYILCPILVTTAELRLLKGEFSIESLRAAESIDDISVSVPFVRMYSEVYPSFDEHCRNIYKDFLQQYHLSNYNFLKELRKVDIGGIMSGKIKTSNMHSQPETLLTSLQHGIGNDLFRETLVCNFSHFPALIKEIKQAISIIGKNLKTIKKQI